MTNSEWVTWHIWERQFHHIFSYDQQRVSDIAHFVKGCLIASFLMINREWVTLYIWAKAVTSHLFLWPTGSEWHCTFCERQSHHIFSYDQQFVSDIEHFVIYSLITSFPMTNSKWVTLHLLLKAVSLHPFLWPTASEQWHCTSCERQSHHIFYYDQQFVSGIAQSHCIFPMINSLWVTLHILCKAVSSVYLWPTASEKHSQFKGNRITPFPMINREWVTVHILWKPVSYTSFLITNREWVTLYTLWKTVSSHLFLWSSACKCHCTFGKSALITSFPMTNRKSVALHLLVSSHPMTIEQEVCDIADFWESQSHYIFSYD